MRPSPAFCLIGSAMLSLTTTKMAGLENPCVDWTNAWSGLADEIGQYFDTEFQVWEWLTKESVWSTPCHPLDRSHLNSSRLTEIATTKQFVVVEEQGGVLILGLPLRIDEKCCLVATAAFLIYEYDVDDSVHEVMTLLGLDEFAARAWSHDQNVWDRATLMRFARVVQEKLAADFRRRDLEDENKLLTGQLVSTYEEIALLYSVTQNLSIATSDSELGNLVLEGLRQCIPAQTLAIQWLPREGENAANSTTYTAPSFLQQGPVAVDEASFQGLLEHANLDATTAPFVANHAMTRVFDWPFPEVAEVVLVAISDGEHVMGYLAAFNHSAAGEFGTIEASLLQSIASVLGIHRGNLELYRQQAEFLESVVQALTSAIDAKDPYTRGHSGRVARVAVMLAKELGFDQDALNQLYMAGLLHDVGKIGIGDDVLKKTSNLSAAEFEEVKRHPELGKRILGDIKQLEEVLPAVLHHHEEWNGKGYPDGLAGDEIPLTARIIAVADAWDAMTSTRPYRQGMPNEKVEAILASGKSSQWDERVINAFFAIRNEVREIRHQHEQRPQGVEQGA